MRYLLPLSLLLMTLFASGCFFTAGFSREHPYKTTICNSGSGYSVTHYRPAYVDGGQAASQCGGGDCARPGYCCPDGLCGDAL